MSGCDARIRAASEEAHLRLVARHYDQALALYDQVVSEAPDGDSRALARAEIALIRRNVFDEGLDDIRRRFEETRAEAVASPDVEASVLLTFSSLLEAEGDFWGARKRLSEAEAACAEGACHEARSAVIAGRRAQLPESPFKATWVIVLGGFILIIGLGRLFEQIAG